MSNEKFNIDKSSTPQEVVVDQTRGATPQQVDVGETISAVPQNVGDQGPSTPLPPASDD